MKLQIWKSQYETFTLLMAPNKENIATQIELYQSAVQNYERLLKAEETKMFYGQSSLFKVNSREQKLINAQQKLMQLKIKHYQTKALLAWVSGVLYVN